MHASSPFSVLEGCTKAGSYLSYRYASTWGPWWNWIGAPLFMPHRYMLALLLFRFATVKFFSRNCFLDTKWTQSQRDRLLPFQGRPCYATVTERFYLLIFTARGPLPASHHFLWHTVRPLTLAETWQLHVMGTAQFHSVISAGRQRVCGRARRLRDS